VTCPACGAVNDSAARFCSTCGTQLAVVGDERRVVTVLFADIVGYTTLAEPLDPEKVKNLVDSWFERLVEDIAEFGGRVDKIVGDAIVALFGAPIAHEDDAERAVRAALRMQQTIATMAPASVRGASGESSVSAGPRLRIGVNTGEVLVGALRAGGAITAMGDVVNTASRLQTSAKPGEVIVGGPTYAATNGVIAYEARGMLAARGREERVEAWSAVETLLPPGYRPRRRTVPLVGRDTELALLRNAIDSSVTNSRSLLVLIVGDAGVGKTRLAAELADWAVVEHEAIALEGRCVPYGEANVWWPVAEALRQACFVEPTATVDEARIRVLDRVAQAYHRPPEDAEVVRVTNGLLHLLGYEGVLRTSDQSSAREEAAQAVVSFVEASSGNQPSVIQLSDLHWADPAVVELIDTMFERLARRPWVLIATARQGIRERWNPPPGRHNAIVVNLDPLETPAASELLESLVGWELPTEVRDALLDRSGGNPFFLEELVSLIGEREEASEGFEGEVTSPELHALPDTLRGLVAARLDGLGPDERTVLTDAAVLGRRGAVAHLRRINESLIRGIDVDRAMAELVAKELFQLDGGKWSFRSDLVREVAYNTLTKGDRAKLHAGIAKWIEQHHEGEWSDGAVDQLAHHYGVAAELGGDLGGPSGVPDDVFEKAVRWLSEAADRARRGELLAVADRLATQALALVGNQPTVPRLELLLCRAGARAEAWDLDGARCDAEQARSDAKALGESGLAARALLICGDVAQKSGQPDAAVGTLAEAASIFATLGDDRGRGEALRLQGMAEMFRGHLHAAEQAVCEALDAFRQVGAATGEAWALQNLAWIAFTNGRADEAERRLDTAVATFRDAGDMVGVAWAQGLLAFVKFQQGDRAAAEVLSQEILVEARGRGDRWATAMMLVLSAGLHLWAGRTEEAVVASAEADAIFTRLGDAYGRSQSVAAHARALMMVGQVDDGLKLFEGAIEAAVARPDAQAELLSRSALAAALVQLGDPDAAFATGILELESKEGAPGLGDSERVVAYALASLQQGKLEAAESAMSTMAVLGGEGSELRPLSLCALAMVAAATGRPHDAVGLAGQVPNHPAATYLDEATAEVAAGLGLARQGDAAGAARWLDQARARVDATGDRLFQAVVRIADAVALRALDDPDAGAAQADADGRLSRLGIEANGWRCAFALVAGVDP
jgi:class 3 adenylate cyclase/tetratricopeptide (TPR) repeat protein